MKKKSLLLSVKLREPDVMIKKVAFTMYPVIDLARARSFYEHKLGLAVGKINSYDNGSWVEYDLPSGGCFAITDMVKDITPSASSGGSIAFEVEDLDKLARDLKKDNIKFILDIFVTPVLCKMAVILDSEGNALTLHQLNKK